MIPKNGHFFPYLLVLCSVLGFLSPLSVWSQPRPGLAEIAAICLKDLGGPAQVNAACNDWIERSRDGGSEMAVAYFQRGLTSYTIGRRPQAMADMDRVLQFNPAHWQALWFKAQWTSWQRQYGAAAVLWEELAKQRPDLAPVQQQHAVALDNAGQADAALAAIQRALELAETEAERAAFTITLGLIHEGRGDYAAALAAQQTAVAAAPNSSVRLRAQGRAQYMLGDFKAARASFEEANKLARDGFTVLWQYLAALRARMPDQTVLTTLPARQGRETWPVSLVMEWRGEGRADIELGLPENASWPRADILAGRRAELNFFRAQKALADGDKTKAALLLRQVLAENFEEYVETRAARVELRRLREQGIGGAE